MASDMDASARGDIHLPNGTVLDFKLSQSGGKSEQIDAYIKQTLEAGTKSVVVGRKGGFYTATLVDGNVVETKIVPPAYKVETISYNRLLQTPNFAALQGLMEQQVIDRGLALIKTYDDFKTKYLK